MDVRGPFALGGAVDTVKRIVEQAGFGVTINNFNADDTSALAARNPNRFAPTTFADGSSNETGNSSGGQLSASLTKGGKQFSSSLKKLSAGVQKALGSLGKKQNNEPNPELTTFDSRLS